MTGRVHAFLAGQGVDHRGRRLSDILAADDPWLESTHDYIQWAFPLQVASRAVPGAPVLEDAEAAAIRRDTAARAGLQAALARMTEFYRTTTQWRTSHDHNHLRISRIIAASRDLLGKALAEAFHATILALIAGPGPRVNANSLAYWKQALE